MKRKIKRSIFIPKLMTLNVIKKIRTMTFCIIQKLRIVYTQLGLMVFTFRYMKNLAFEHFNVIGLVWL